MGGPKNTFPTAEPARTQRISPPTMKHLYPNSQALARPFMTAWCVDGRGIAVVEIDNPG
jgi:hypothetical protein